MCVGYTLIYAILYKRPGTNPQRMQRDDCINFSKVVMVCVCMPNIWCSIVQMVQLTWKLPTKLILHQPSDPAISQLCTHPKEMKTDAHNCS